MIKTKKGMLAVLACLAISIVPVPGQQVLAAQAPAFATTTIKLQGVGSVNKYALKINNTEKYKDFSFVWTSSNPKIIKVSKAAGQGNAQDGYYCNLVPKTKGTAEIKCVVTYTTKKNVQKKKTLKAAVEVTVPSDRSEDNHIVNKEISDENTQTQYIYEGDTYEFEGAVSPVGSSDHIYWKSTDESVFTVDEDGVVTGVGEGAAVLEMYVGATQESAFAQDMLDSVKIRTIARPGVKSVELSDTNTLVITFTQAVEKSTVVSGTGLSSNISILPVEKDGKTGKELGSCLAVLNTKGKVLTVITENEFSGAYEFIISDQIMTAEGNVAIAAYDKVKKVTVALED
jgi:hypothetical protein